jgi:hypothetical protein
VFPDKHADAALHTPVDWTKVEELNPVSLSAMSAW